jgi:hypothetical protein
VSPWKVILATVIIFGTGVLTGGFVAQRAFRAKPPLPAPMRPQGEALPTPFFVRREFLDRMDRQLNLSRDQYDRIARILQDSQERTRLIMGLVSPEIQEELRAVREQIRAELRPEQRPKFEELQHLLNPRRPGGPGPFPPDGPPRGERRPPPRDQGPSQRPPGPGPESRE